MLWILRDLTDQNQNHEFIEGDGQEVRKKKNDDFYNFSFSKCDLIVRLFMLKDNAFASRWNERS